MSIRHEINQVIKQHMVWAGRLRDAVKSARNDIAVVDVEIEIANNYFVMLDKWLAMAYIETSFNVFFGRAAIIASTSECRSYALSMLESIGRHGRDVPRPQISSGNDFDINSTLLILALMAWRNDECSS